METSSDSDEDVLTMMRLASVSATTIATVSDSGKSTKYRGGSKHGRAPNRYLGVNKKSHSLDIDYFCRYRPDPPLLSEEKFEQAFRMPRTVYEQFRSALIEDEFFNCRPDATGKRGAGTDLKIYTAITMLAEARSKFSMFREADVSSPVHEMHEGILCKGRQYVCKGMAPPSDRIGAHSNRATILESLISWLYRGTRLCWLDMG